MVVTIVKKYEITVKYNIHDADIRRFRDILEWLCAIMDESICDVEFKEVA